MFCADVGAQRVQVYLDRWRTNFKWAFRCVSHSERAGNAPSFQISVGVERAFPGKLSKPRHPTSLERAPNGRG